MNLVYMIETRTHTRNMRVGLKPGGKQHFWYEKFRHLWTGDGELLDHRLLELPPIRCPQPNYTKSSEVQFQPTTWVSRDAPNPLTLKSANGFLNMVAVGDTVAGVNCPMHATHLIYTLRDHYVLAVLFGAVTVPWQGEQVEANDVYIGESAMKRRNKYIALKKRTGGKGTRESGGHFWGER